MKKFQNILCYCLTSLLVSLRCVRFISKHPMLLFNVPAFIFCIAEPNISKHPMLLFNIRQSDVWRFGFNISKHPMLLFNGGWNITNTALYSFQNILCYCLTNVFKPFSQLKSLYTPILHYLIQNYQPANHLFKCVFI